MEGKIKAVDFVDRGKELERVKLAMDDIDHFTACERLMVILICGIGDRVDRLAEEMRLRYGQQD